VAYWCHSNGVAHREARLHMALAYFVVGKRNTRAKMLPVWRGEAEELLGVKGP